MTGGSLVGTGSANGQLKTMLRQGSRAENEAKAKKNVRFVTESVSSGYSSSELDIHMNIPMSPNVKFAPSPAAAPALIYRNNNSNNNNNGNNNVFQYPPNGSQRQLTFVPNPAVPHGNNAETVRAKQMFISPPPSVSYLPTIVEQPSVVYAQQQRQQQQQQQQQRMHVPPQAGVQSYGYPCVDSERWNRWNSLVLFHWPYLSQLDEQSRFDKICELSVIAASATNCLCSQCRA